MIDWASLEVGQWWPLPLAALAGLVLMAIWFRRQGTLFPDLALLASTAARGGLGDRLPAILGILVALLVTVALLQPSVARSVTVARQARDFLLIVDVSGSMLENTTVARAAVDLRYPRRAGFIYGRVEDPSTLPYLARYELARESLLAFVGQRRAHDRVALLYFDHEVTIMSSFTSDMEFITGQLAEMDDYVVGGTDLEKAMQAGLNLLERYPTRNRRALILLTDAEVYYNTGLERQFARLSGLDVSFYLLWIVPSERLWDHTRRFLELAESLGEVFAVRDLDQRNLSVALAAISQLEEYTYEQVRWERVDLAVPIVQVTRWLILAWVLLVASIYHPRRGNAVFGEE